jgi:hypothetical protein
MDRNFYQELRKLSTRTVKLPSGLTKYTVYYDKDGRAEWPASPYYVARVDEHLDLLEGDHECTTEDYFSMEEFKTLGFNHPFQSGSSFEFNETSLRVRQVLSKWGACPLGETKRQALPKARQAEEQAESQGLSLETRYSAVESVRTSSGPPEEGKARFIASVATPDWIVGVKGFSDALTRTDEAIQTFMPVMLFHTEPSKLAEWFGQFNGEVISWLSWDWSSYDGRLAAPLMEEVARYLMGDFAFANQEVDFLLNASLMTHRGTVTRHGANLSGHISTNILNSLTNVLHFLKVLERLNLLRYVVCVLVNGDDIVIGFSTRIIDANVRKIEHESFMSANVTKVDIGDYIWHSKLIIELDATGKIIVSRIPELVYNRIKYPERRKDKLEKWIISMGMASTLEELVIKDHEFPTGGEILRHFSKIDNLDINEASDAELMPSAEIMAADLNWRSLETGQDVIDYVRNTRYVRQDF